MDSASSLIYVRAERRNDLTGFKELGLFLFLLSYASFKFFLSSKVFINTFPFISLEGLFLGVYLAYFISYVLSSESFHFDFCTEDCLISLLALS